MITDLVFYSSSENFDLFFIYIYLYIYTCIYIPVSLQECSNEVTAFCLDEDFDYDNVVLTPKFTVEEVAFLKSCKT